MTIRELIRYGHLEGRYLDIVLQGPFNEKLLARHQFLNRYLKLSLSQHRKPFFVPKNGETPCGVLWIGVDATWRKYIYKHLGESTYQPLHTYRVMLSDDTCLINIDSPESAKSFFEVFGKTEYFMSYDGKREVPHNHYIQWERVRNYSDGILIDLPYWNVSDMKKYPGTEWLYSFDCRCIAIWHVRSGTTFQRILFKKEARQAKREGWNTPVIKYVSPLGKT